MLEWKGQGNPYKFGLIGSTDTHLAGAFEESNFWSKVGVVDGSPMSRGSIPLTEQRWQLKEYSANIISPLAQLRLLAILLLVLINGVLLDWAVWAENAENQFFPHSKERSFATTGPKVAVRFFAGFDLTSIDINAESLVEEAYSKGVPMGQTYLLMEKKFRIYCLGPKR